MPAWAGGRRRTPAWRRLLPYLVFALAIPLALWLNAADPLAALGQPLTGTPGHIVDGDTLDLGGQRIRLAGLDAPELAQACTDATGNSWPCGRNARARLVALVGNQALTCHPLDHDRYQRLVAQCETAQGDPARRLVAEGLAVATDRYADAEQGARNSRLGIWAGPFQRPADYRAERRQTEGGQPSRFEQFLSWIGTWFGS